MGSLDVARWVTRIARRIRCCSLRGLKNALLVPVRPRLTCRAQAEADDVNTKWDCATTNQGPRVRLRFNPKRAAAGYSYRLDGSEANRRGHHH